MIPPGDLRREKVPLDQATSAVLKDACAAYDDMRRGAPMLAYRDLEPERFRAGLANIALIEVRPEGAKRFLIRLAGHEIENREFGYVGGAFVEDIGPAHYRDELLAAYEEVRRTARPSCERIVSRYDFGKFEYWRLILPLSRELMRKPHAQDAPA